MTLTLLLVILYFFTIYGYLSLYNYYDDRCETMLFCFVETFDLTFKNDGGVGSFFENVKSQDPTNYDYERFFFDNIENYLIVIIMINIVAGLKIKQIIMNNLFFFKKK